MTYFAYITKITDLRPIPKADNLIVGKCYGQDVVVGKDTVEGQLGIYFGADGRLLPEFLEANNLIKKIAADGTKSGGLFDEKGKVRVQKLRGQASNGFFCPLSFLAYTGGELTDLKEGMELQSFNGKTFCEKYTKPSSGGNSNTTVKESLKSKFPYFREHIDTKRLLYKLDELTEGMDLVITEKLHGTSQRTAYALESQQTWWGSLINGLCRKTIIKPRTAYKYVSGTRRTVIKDFERHVGFYAGKEKFRQRAHDAFVGKLFPGETIYYELVGYVDDGGTIMPPGDTTKLQSKELTKRYGKQMVFKYGCVEGTSCIYVYRITLTNEDGVEVDYSWNGIVERCHALGVNPVPYIYSYNYDGNTDALTHRCEECASGCSALDSSHIKEGVVVRADGKKWEAWKYKSWEFDCLEDNLKVNNVFDIEEINDNPSVQ